ncbi:predicted protein [Nematostella vectensis]|uniref:Uncharacterized protein n=1 Tax=Nematostella vectensis TaxID=45351 RepID=A7RZ33_NEMVE|nr:predicted protein [Nematostella vectensis]|eukprot:XP_001635348.1 predicted protein [Nematostella vectensis]
MESETRQVTAIVVGCGNRGQNYSSYALECPQRLKIVAVADPIKSRRQKIARMSGLTNEELIVDDWVKLSSKGTRIADCVFICTQDQFHCGPAVSFASRGYHILLEKPMSVEEKECEEIAMACQKANVILAVCHVLRYFPPVLKIKEIIDQGYIGEVVTVDHRENILYWHFAHSFVRGNWRNVKTSTFSLMAKSCHDIDLIMFWMGDRKCNKIQSFGSLKHFRQDQKPKGAGQTCLSCPEEVERLCPYSAKKIYLDRLKTLKSGPYGKCVYECDNDVVDHQVVNMEFENEATASFTMNAFTKDMRRETRICGTKGELRWDGSSHGPIEVFDFTTGKGDQIFPDQTVPESTRLRGHGGADFFMIDAFIKSVSSNDQSLILTGIKDSLRSHKVVFAAERSRLNNTIETVDI